jgi:7,8-dihydropterin-6-yl-methyl-4-(beta-D-ribofuranosyl)aminobenzene 5'-phosphate synthase
VLVGGFHFKSLPADSPALIQAAQALMALPTTYYTGHCTGEEQFATLKKYMGKRLQALHSGTVLEL